MLSVCFDSAALPVRSAVLDVDIATTASLPRLLVQ
jgi:hypothetical protein